MKSLAQSLCRLYTFHSSYILSVLRRRQQNGCKKRTALKSSKPIHRAPMYYMHPFRVSESASANQNWLENMRCTMVMGWHHYWPPSTWKRGDMGFSMSTYSTSQVSANQCVSFLKKPIRYECFMSVFWKAKVRIAKSLRSDNDVHPQHPRVHWFFRKNTNYHGDWKFKTFPAKI